MPHWLGWAGLCPGCVWRGSRGRALVPPDLRSVHPVRRLWCCGTPRRRSASSAAQRCAAPPACAAHAAAACWVGPGARAERLLLLLPRALGRAGAREVREPAQALYLCGLLPGEEPRLDLVRPVLRGHGGRPHDADACMRTAAARANGGCDQSCRPDPLRGPPPGTTSSQTVHTRTASAGSLVPCGHPSTATPTATWLATSRWARRVSWVAFG